MEVVAEPEEADDDAMDEDDDGEIAPASSGY